MLETYPQSIIYNPKEGAYYFHPEPLDAFKTPGQRMREAADIKFNHEEGDEIASEKNLDEQVMDSATNPEIIGDQDGLVITNNPVYQLEFTQWLLMNSKLDLFEEANMDKVFSLVKETYAQFMFESTRDDGLFDELVEFNRFLYNIFLEELVSASIVGEIYTYPSQPTDFSGPFEDAQYFVLSVIQFIQETAVDDNYMPIDHDDFTIFVNKYFGGSYEILDTLVDYTTELLEIVSWMDENNDSDLTEA